MSAPADAADRALLRVLPEVLPEVRPGAAAQGPEVSEESLRRAAARHGLTPLLSLLRPWPEGERARVQQVGRHLRALSDLTLLAPLLDGAGVPWVVLKGPVLSARTYPRPDLREYDDLDVLVAPDRLDDVLDLLASVGTCVVDHAWELLLERRHGEVSLQLPRGTSLDLHWHLLNGAHLRQEFPVDVSRLLAASVAADLHGVPARVPHPADGLVHLCLHAAKSGGHRLLWVLDVDRWVRSHVDDWDRVVRTAHGWGAGLVVAVVLGRARRLLGTPVPRSTLSALAPSSPWRLALAAHDRSRTLSGGDEGRRSGRLLVESTRTTTSRSVRRLLSQLPALLGDRPVDETVPPRAARPLSAAPARTAWTQAAGEEADRLLGIAPRPLRPL